jgi:hypothetical protein
MEVTGGPVIRNGEHTVPFVLSLGAGSGAPWTDGERLSKIGDEWNSERQNSIQPRVRLRSTSYDETSNPAHEAARGY